MKRGILAAGLALALVGAAHMGAQPPSLAEGPILPRAEALGIGLEGFPYPHPVAYLPLVIHGQDARLAYMDVPAEGASNGRTVVLFHGKNFFGEYWAGTIEVLRREGFRVVVPDQVGFGKSSKPIVPYSFHRMAAQTRELLEVLGAAGRVAVVGHSMGGMAAARFALMYPDITTHLVLVNALGLEDYRTLRPWRSAEEIYPGELAKTEEQIRRQFRNYFVRWPEEFEKYVQVHYRWTLGPEYPRLAFVSALTAQMIHEQPVVHEFSALQARTLIIGGSVDRPMGGTEYPVLARRAAEAIPRAEAVLFDDVGHNPHFEASELFHEELTRFLRAGW